MSKLPQITVAFWIMKILATTFGETGGDLVAQTMGVGYAVSSLILISFFVIALTFQLRARTFKPFLFWTVVITTSTAGTTISDYIDKTMDLGNLGGSALLFVVLISCLALWRFTTGTLAVADVRTRRDEYFYWFTILISNTLGTAVGDSLSNEGGLGYVGGMSVVVALLAIILVAYYVTDFSRVALFWSAFVLTRPFGAVFGNFLAKAHAKGGLEIGTLNTSLILIGLLAVIIFYDLKKNEGKGAVLSASITN